MTDRKLILETYYAKEKECGGPHCINDAIWATASALGLTREEVKAVVIQDQIGGAV